MKLNLGKRNKGKRRCQISVRVSAITKKNWTAILKANPEYKSWELFDLAVESLIKEYGEKK